MSPAHEPDVRWRGPKLFGVRLAAGFGSGEVALTSQTIAKFRVGLEVLAVGNHRRA